MVLNIQVSQSRSEDWYHRTTASLAKPVTLSPLSGGLRMAGCSFRGLQGDSRPTYIRSDVSNISRGPPCTTPGLSPDKVPAREPPKMGEGGNWQCHVCLNVNYPRRTACNRCLTERNKENTQKVAEFIRLKEGFLQMGLDQQTASAAAAAQQAARSCASGGISTGATPENADRLHTSTSTGNGSVLAQDVEGLRLLSYPLEQQQQSRPLFDKVSLQLLLQQPTSERSANPELQQHTQLHPCVGFKSAGISSRETSGGLLRSNSSTSNSGESSSGCVSDEEAATSSLSRLNAALRLSSGLSASNNSGGASGNSSEMQFIMLKAGMLLGKLLRELDDQEQQQQQTASATTANPATAAKADDVLRAALGMLANEVGATTGDRQPQGFSNVNPMDSLPPLQPQQQRHQQLGYPQMLAHPDEFRNPSSFLKIYGDPLCSLSPASAAAFLAGGSSSTSPAANRDGNWVCTCCNNINFPRRFRCNKCNEPRGPEGDKIVAEYARAVYTHHAERIRMQQLQQQLHQLQQQDMQQMQMHMEQLQMQQQRQQRQRQRQRTAPASHPVSPIRGAGAAPPKLFGSAVAAAAAAAAASVAAARPVGTAVLPPKTGTSARMVTSPGAVITAPPGLVQQKKQDKVEKKPEDKVVQRGEEPQEKHQSSEEQPKEEQFNEDRPQEEQHKEQMQMQKQQSDEHESKEQHDEQQNQQLHAVHSATQETPRAGAALVDTPLVHDQ